MYYGINKQEPYPITFIQGDIIMESESKYEFSPFAPGIPLSEKPCKKAPAKVCTIWDDEEEKFCIHNGCILAFTSLENVNRYLPIALAYSPEMCKVIEFEWSCLPEVIPNPAYTTVLLNFDPKSNATGPYEVYFIR